MTRVNRIVRTYGALLVLGLSSAVVMAEGAGAPAAPATAAAAKPARSVKPVGPEECVRTGQRVIAALARDDSGAANQFFTFYKAFDCPQSHLAHAFGCLVKLQAKEPTITNPTPEQVGLCWADPAKVPEVTPPAPPAQPETQGNKP